MEKPSSNFVDTEKKQEPTGKASELMGKSMKSTGKVSKPTGKPSSNFADTEKNEAGKSESDGYTGEKRMIFLILLRGCCVEIGLKNYNIEGDSDYNYLARQI
ncbi:hypothetical protein SAMN05421736_101712 [Evansella caseinilytica]|uniref:Uncharacterized protein n=1 Tax=Evansella caseinilytica TaxID=1503961 RepID=A0A1H3I4A6_9BACI|nr:hypothetical protein [Evansella caseinilytica]SDY22491.1 hypothetical protein SAMN05421736_101712 [Evansella caseinilytica]